MIRFREIRYSEYDAMRELYNELNKNNTGEYGKRFEIISRSYLPGILKGNSVVVEKFTITSKLLGRDRYRMYVRVGSKAKLPDKVKLPKSYRDKPMPLSIALGFGGSDPTSGESKKNRSRVFKLDVQTTESKLLGDIVSYDRTERLLVVEVDSVNDASKALFVLPFGLNYKVYLLD